MKKFIFLLIFSVFVAFLTSSCMARLSPDGSYGNDSYYRNNDNRNNYNSRSRFDRNREARRDRNRDRQNYGDRDENGALIIRY